MHIDNDKAIGWLDCLKNGVENSNHSAEVAVTKAMAAHELVDALELLLQCPDLADVDGEHLDPETVLAERIARRALNRARGE